MYTGDDILKHNADRKLNILKGFVETEEFFEKGHMDFSGGGSPKGNLVKKQITDKTGHNTTRWVKNGEDDKGADDRSVNADSPDSAKADKGEPTINVGKTDTTNSTINNANPSSKNQVAGDMSQEAKTPEQHAAETSDEDLKAYITANPDGEHTAAAQAELSKRQGGNDSIGDGSLSDIISALESGDIDEMHHDSIQSAIEEATGQPIDNLISTGGGGSTYDNIAEALEQNGSSGQELLDKINSIMSGGNDSGQGGAIPDWNDHEGIKAYLQSNPDVKERMMALIEEDLFLPPISAFKQAIGESGGNAETHAHLDAAQQALDAAKEASGHPDAAGNNGGEDDLDGDTDTPEGILKYLIDSLESGEWKGEDADEFVKNLEEATGYSLDDLISTGGGETTFENIKDALEAMSVPIEEVVEGFKLTEGSEDKETNDEDEDYNPYGEDGEYEEYEEDGKHFLDNEDNSDNDKDKPNGSDEEGDYKEESVDAGENQMAEEDEGGSVEKKNKQPQEKSWDDKVAEDAKKRQGFKPKNTRR